MRISDWSSDVCSSDLLARTDDDPSADRGDAEAALDLLLAHLGAARGKAYARERALDFEFVIRDSAGPPSGAALPRGDQLGRASCRGRVCLDVLLAMVAC